MKFDLIVIGGGPGGYVAAIKAAQLDGKVLLAEKENLGCVCLNKGCIPAKTLLKCSGMYKSLKKAEHFGISIENVAFDFKKMMERKKSVVASLVNGIKGLIKANPQCIYSHPEIAWVGLTENEAAAKGYEVSVGKFPLAANGKSLAEGDTSGFIKVIADTKYGEILGVHMVCTHATDMISEGTLAISLEATAKEIASTMHPLLLYFVPAEIKRQNGYKRCGSMVDR